MLAPKVVHAFHLPVSLLLLKCVPEHVATVRVSFTCQLDWPWGPRRLDAGYVLEGSVDRVSQGPPGVCVLGGESSNPSTPGWHRRSRRSKLSLRKPDVHLFLPRDVGDIVALGASALRVTLGLKGPVDPSLSQASDSAGSCSLAVLGPQPAGGLWGFSVSITTDTDSYNKSLLFRGFPGASIVKGSETRV